MELETVKYEVKDRICTITLNRPEKRNALNTQLLNDIDAAFERAENDPDVRVVILAGAGTSFCAGYDIKDSPYMTLPEGVDKWSHTHALKALRKIGERYQMMFYFTKPVIAKVQGYCVAAGCYLQMCCDLSVAAENAVFGHTATRGGGVTSMPLWVTLLGLRKAKEMLMTTKLINGKEAEEIGLVNRCVKEEDLDDATWELALNLAEVPPDGMVMMKEVLNTHMRIAGLDAEFVYHRQLNAMNKVAKGGTVLDLDAIKKRTQQSEKRE